MIISTSLFLPCFVFPGGLTFAELSILLDRSLAGLAKIVGCPAVETLAAPYCREFLRKAVSQRDASQEEQDSDEISSSRGEVEENEDEESDEEQEEGISCEDEENEDDDDMAMATSTDEVPLALFINILHEVMYFLSFMFVSVPLLLESLPSLQLG